MSLVIIHSDLIGLHTSFERTIDKAHTHRVSLPFEYMRNNTSEQSLVLMHTNHFETYRALHFSSVSLADNLFLTTPTYLAVFF